MGKPIAIKFGQRWVEFWAIFLIFVGLLFAITLISPWQAYLIAFAMGAMLGRLLWRFRKNLKGSVLTIILGFLAGFILFMQSADRKVIIALFVLGLVVSFYVHDRNIIRGTEY